MYPGGLLWGYRADRYAPWRVSAKSSYRRGPPGELRDLPLPGHTEVLQRHPVVEQVGHRIQAVYTGGHDDSAGTHAIQLRAVDAWCWGAGFECPDAVQELAARADDHQVGRPQALLSPVVDGAHRLLGHLVLGHARDTSVGTHALLQVAVDEVVVVLVGDGSVPAEPIAGGDELARRNAVRAPCAIRIVL